jgi:hypothetical protein
MNTLGTMLLTTLTLLGLTIGIGIIAAIFTAVRKYYADQFFNWMNKRHGKSYFIVSGSQEVVGIVYQVCVSTLQTVQEQQATAQKTAEGIQLNDKQTRKEENSTR